MSKERLFVLALAALFVLLPACSRELKRACDEPGFLEQYSCGSGVTCFTTEGKAYGPPCDQSGSSAFPLIAFLISAVAFWGVPAFFINRAAKARGLESRYLIAAWTIFGGLGLAYALFKGIPARTGEPRTRSDDTEVF